MANVLIATLGDHPTVVTAMVHALRHKVRIHPDMVYVVYPEVDTDRMISLGYDLIEERLNNHLPKANRLPNQCKICAKPVLGISDVKSYEQTITFLRTLAELFEHCEENGDSVYISLAGGRKNMSAMTALITQFYPCVKQLYHLIDRDENSNQKRHFLRAEELYYLSDRDATQDKFFPDPNRLALVEIPFKSFSNAKELRSYFQAVERKKEFNLPLSPEADTFFSNLFQPNRSTQLLEVYLSETAYNHYEALPKGSEHLTIFRKCFRQMQDPYALKGHIHGTFGGISKTFHFFKLRRTVERPFFYTKPNPIHLFPQKSVHKVIICGLSIEQSDGSYDPTGEDLRDNAKTEAYKHLSELETNKVILVVPLGETPMIATQTYVLLKDKKFEVTQVIVIYPKDYAPARSGVKVLKSAFKRRKIPFEQRPIEGLSDIDKKEHCETYAKHLMSVINKLQNKHPDRQIALSLSGGRKGMSALTLFAAQPTGIEHVYHTLITDPKLEDRVAEECSLEKLCQASKKEQAKRLFLETKEYDRSKFVLFQIPVIPVK